MRSLVLLSLAMVASPAYAQFAFFDDGGAPSQFGICYPDGGSGAVLDVTGQLVLNDSVTVLGQGAEGYPEVNGSGTDLYLEANPAGNCYIDTQVDDVQIACGQVDSGTPVYVTVVDAPSPGEGWLEIGVTPQGDGGSGVRIYAEAPGFPTLVYLRDDGRVTTTRDARDPGDCLALDQLCVAPQYAARPPDGGSGVVCVDPFAGCSMAPRVLPPSGTYVSREAVVR